MSDANRFSNILQQAKEHIEPTEPPTTTALDAAPPIKPKSVPQNKKPFGRPPTGKRSNPDYEPTTVFLREDTKRSAAKILLDQKEKDLSDVLEALLAGWVRKNS